MNFNITAFSKQGICTADEKGVTFISNGDYAEGEVYFTVDFTFNDWEDDCYIFMPACAYNGNRFKRVKRNYPPMYKKEEAGVNCEPLMTNVPALNPDGSGSIYVTSGDMATPCVGIFNRNEKKGFLIFTTQGLKEKNVGFLLTAGKLTLSYPTHRETMYRSCCEYDKADDYGISATLNEKIEAEYKIFTFSCNDIPEFYKVFFEKRKCLLSNERSNFGYSEKMLKEQIDKFNKDNWKSGRYYSELGGVWQSGWIGGPIAAYALLKVGNELAKKNAKQTLDFLAEYQAKSGFYHGIVNVDVILDDSFGMEGMEHLHLIRKSADSLYFLLKCFELVEPYENWINSAKKCADAFVRLFETYGTFGQFINVETGEMVVGVSTSGAMAVAALVKAWKYFGEEKYLEIAKKACRFYYNEFICKGYTTGGPGEILSAPDSESAFAMLESCVTLYEETREEEWLRYAQDVAHQCSSWVVTYSYEFPKGCEFNRLNINAVGGVFANVQNKHSAPGICTLSGDSLYKLYKFTGNKEYLELLLDIASCIPQCVSSEERPIYVFGTNDKQPAGYICERINMSDWETKSFVGGIFAGSNWPECSLLLGYADLMDYPETRDVLKV